MAQKSTYLYKESVMIWMSHKKYTEQYISEQFQVSYNFV